MRKALVVALAMLVVGMNVTDARMTLMQGYVDQVKNSPGTHDQSDHGVWSEGAKPPTPQPTPMPKPSSSLKEKADKLPDPSSVPKFNSKTEMNDWLKRNGLINNIQIGNIDPKLQKPLCEAYIVMAKAYPDITLRNRVWSVNSDVAPLSIVNALTGGKIGAFAFAPSAFIPDTGIVINEAFASDATYFANAYGCTEGGKRVGFHPIQKNNQCMGIVVAHELGHALYNELDAESLKEWNRMYNDPDIREKYIVGRQISVYAEDSPEECYCEAIAAYHFGVDRYKGNPVVQKAIEFTDKRKRR
jgi:hypothetical protein